MRKNHFPQLHSRRLASAERRVVCRWSPTRDTRTSGTHHLRHPIILYFEVTVHNTSILHEMFIVFTSYWSIFMFHEPYQIVSWHTMLNRIAWPFWILVFEYCRSLDAKWDTCLKTWPWSTNSPWKKPCISMPSSTILTWLTSNNARTFWSISWNYPRTIELSPLFQVSFSSCFLLFCCVISFHFSLFCLHFGYCNLCFVCAHACHIMLFICMFASMHVGVFVCMSLVPINANLMICFMLCEHDFECVMLNTHQNVMQQSSDPPDLTNRVVVFTWWNVMPCDVFRHDLTCCCFSFDKMLRRWTTA